MNRKIESTALFVTPLLGLAIFATGLIRGASPRDVYADIFTAPVSPNATAFPLEIAVAREEASIGETLEGVAFSVVATGCGAMHRASLVSDAHGATVWNLPKVDDCRPHVTVSDTASTLADGMLEVSFGTKSALVPRPPLSPTKRHGSIFVDVYSNESRLVVDAKTVLYVHAPSKEAIEWTVEPEPGLAVLGQPASRCPEWYEVPVQVLHPRTGLSIHARSGGTDGLWFGGLPTMSGAADLALGKKGEVTVTWSGPQKITYLALFDESGRTQMAAGNEVISLGGVSLAAGTWAMASSEPRAFDLAEGVVKNLSLLAHPPCDQMAKMLTQKPAFAVTPELVLSGRATMLSRHHERRRRGVTIALSGMLSAFLVEALLLGLAARRARLATQALDVEAKFTRVPLWWPLLIGLGFTGLALSMLAVMLFAK